MTTRRGSRTYLSRWIDRRFRVVEPTGELSQGIPLVWCGPCSSSCAASWRWLGQLGWAHDGHDPSGGLHLGADSRSTRTSFIRELPRAQIPVDSGFLARLDLGRCSRTQGLGNLWVALGIVAVLVVGSIRISGCCCGSGSAAGAADKNAMQDKNCTYLCRRITRGPGVCTKFSKPDSAITNAPQKIIEDVMKSVLTPLVYIAGFGGLLAVGSTSCPDCWAVVLVEGKL